jgi:hypothetical protein
MKMQVVSRSHRWLVTALALDKIQSERAPSLGSSSALLLVSRPALQQATGQVLQPLKVATRGQTSSPSSRSPRQDPPLLRVQRPSLESNEQRQSSPNKLKKLKQVFHKSTTAQVSTLLFFDITSSPASPYPRVGSLGRWNSSSAMKRAPAAYQRSDKGHAMV